MTNYNPKNIERQLELPGMENSSIENIASASPETKTRKGLRPRTYGIIGAIALAISAASYGGYQLNETRKAMEEFGKFNKGFIELINQMKN